MSARTLGTLIDVGIDILNTVLDKATNSVLAQIGDVIHGSSSSDNAEWWQHVGFASRPSQPTAGKSAAQCMAYKQSERDAIFASRDVRGQAIYGALSDGETCIYAGGTTGTAQGRILLKANGNVAMYTAAGNASGGQSVTVQCNADGTINLASQFGGISINSKGIQILSAGGAGLQIGADGNVAIIGTAIAVNGSSVSLGANATMPLLWGPTGIVGVASLSVKVAL